MTQLRIPSDTGGRGRVLHCDVGHATTGTGAVAIAVAAAISGTVVQRAIRVGGERMGTGANEVNRSRLPRDRRSKP